MTMHTATTLRRNRPPEIEKVDLDGPKRGEVQSRSQHRASLRRSGNANPSQSSSTGSMLCQLMNCRSLAPSSLWARWRTACRRPATGRERPRGRMRDLIASDIAALGFIMSEVMCARLLHLRLDVVSTDACRRFHIDNMTARMLCTYRGNGTQVAQPIREQAPLELTTRAAAILRGALWPGRAKTGLLHRSPPISGAGQNRLLLVIDPGADYRPDRAFH